MNATTTRLSVRDALYEKPGPKALRKIRVVTVFSSILFIVLFALIIRQFYITGQLDSRYWFFFLRYTTWRFLGLGLLGTIEAAAIAGVIALFAGFLLMIARISRYKVLNVISIAVIEFTRGVPTDRKSVV